MESCPDFLSPFEELVMTAIREAGNGVDETRVWLKVRQLAQRQTIRLMRVQLTLSILERDGCLHSWYGDPTPLGGWTFREYRVQLYGELALDAAIQRRGSELPADYFHRASRFGCIWDLMLARAARKRAEKSRYGGPRSSPSRRA